MRKPVVFVLLVVTLLLSACGPAVRPAAGPVTEGGEVFAIALPRIVVDYDLQGNPSIEGLDLGYIDRLSGANLSGNLRLQAGYPQWMMRANVQHVEVRQAGNGVTVFVNGKPMPYVAWDDASLQKTTDLVGMMTGGQLNTSLIGRFMPIVRRLGVDTVMRFPRQPGVAEIPLADANATGNVVTKASGRPASALVQFEIKYDQNGVPAILGISAAELLANGISLGNSALSPQAIQTLQTGNVQSLELRGKEDGVFVYVNGEPLPNIAWDDTLLNNVADVYGQMNDQTVREVQVVKQLLPMVNKADLGVLIHFPVAPGKQPIAVKMH